MMRQTWDAYFLSIAQQVSARSTCTRKAVGCVLTLERRIIATGYNGSLPGAPHCAEAGCMIADVTYSPDEAPHTFRHCVRTVHAETNALLQAAKHGCATLGTHAYVSASPCKQCMMHLISAGVAEVIYAEPYRLELTAPIAAAAGIVLRQGA